MNLYFSTCSKAANSAANETTTSSLATDSQQCGDLFRPSYGFNLTDPYCRLLENQYQSLHDPHLRAYYKRKDNLRRLKKGGYITSNNKIICSLRELNKYRQYLTSLKLDFERNYIKEQRILSKEFNRLQDNNQTPRHNTENYQNCSLQENGQFVKEPDRLIKNRYMDMITKELEQLERAAEEQRLLRMDREDKRQREHAKRKLNLRRKMEEEWKTKELLLLAKIGEDVKREARIEEQRRKNREESDRKKQALLEKKMAHHLQKFQENGFKREEMGKNAYEYRGQDVANIESLSPKKKRAYDELKFVYPVSEQKTNKGIDGPTITSIYQSRSSPKNVWKSSATSVYQPDIKDIYTERKKSGTLTIKTSVADVRDVIDNTEQESNISPEPSPMRHSYRSSTSHYVPPKEEKDMDAVWYEKSSMKSNHYYNAAPQFYAKAHDVYHHHPFTNVKHKLLENCFQEKVTSRELNNIIQNIMTWVVATVTSILYPAITKYEERLHNAAFRLSDDSILSSDSSSFCSTCSDEFTYRNYTTATTKSYQRDPCTIAVDMPVKRPTTPLKPPSPVKEVAIVKKNYHMQEQTITSQLDCKKTKMICDAMVLKKSDAILVAPFDKEVKDATTETDNLMSVLISDTKAIAMKELENLKNVFVNFKCHLKGETELILESIFHELMSDLKQAIPSISSVTAEVFVGEHNTEKEVVPEKEEPSEKDELSLNVDISTAASEIVDTILENLHFAVEKRCVEISSEEDFSQSIAPNLLPSRENVPSSDRKPSQSPFSEMAEDIVHGILEKLRILASCNQNEPHHVQYATKHPDQINVPHKRTNTNICTTELDESDLIVKEKIQNLMSKTFSKSSLVGYIEEAIGTILQCIQTELNNDRFFTSEETIVLLQVLDDIFTELHKEPEKANVKKCRHSMLRSPDTEERYRLTGTRLCHGRQAKRPFSPVNVPGMVLYPEDNDEEIDIIVKNVIDSSSKDKEEKSKHLPENLFTKGNTCFENRRNQKTATKPAPENTKVSFPDGELKTELPFFNCEEILKEKSCINKDTLLFTQDQKRQIQSTSETTVKCILTEMLEELCSVPPGCLDSKTGKEKLFFPSGKPHGLSYQEWMNQMFSMSEISTVVQEVTDDVLDILMKASDYIPNVIKCSSSIYKNIQDSSDTYHMVKEVPKEETLDIWFESEKKMKYLSSLNLDPEGMSLLQLSENEPGLIDRINNNIINTVFKRLKLLIFPKLQMTFKPSFMEKSAFQSQLSTYTTKVVNIVLHAIQNELDLNKKKLTLKETDCPKSLTSKKYYSDHDELESLLSSIDDECMASPLLTCICDLLSCRQSDEGSIFFSSDKSVPGTSYGATSTGKQNVLSDRHDKSFNKMLSTPCSLHSISNGKDYKEDTTVQVLDNIGETLHEMLRKMIGTHSHSLPPCSNLNTKSIKNDEKIMTELKSNIQCISQTILECILTKLCSFDTDNSFTSPRCKVLLGSLDTDSLSFASVTEEIAKCLKIISKLVSRIVKKDNTEVIKSIPKTITVPSNTPDPKVLYPNKPKDIALDILNMVFDKLERFVNVNVENSYSIDHENKESSKTDCEIISDTQEEPMQSALYMNAKKVAKTILKAIQTELNMNSLDLRSSVKNVPSEKQIIKNIVNSILSAVSSDIFDEAKSEEIGMNDFHYKPIYGNYLPGGGESNSNTKDSEQTEKETNGEKTSQRDETKSNSLKQLILERTLNEIEVKLKEPQKSPIIPIVRNILNEIFQGSLIDQLNVLPLPYSKLRDLSHTHNVNEPISQASFQLIDQTINPLVSEADVNIVAHDVVRTVFHKLFIVAMTERNASDSRYKTITFSTNVSFHEHTYGGKSTLTLLNKNPCTLQSRVTVDKQTKMNVVEDIVKAILTHLESFATSKVKSLFCHEINFTVPAHLSKHSDKTIVSQVLSVKDSNSDDPLPCFPVDHITPKYTNSLAQLSFSKLNVYATEVARKILQGIKHELDKERENPLLTHNIVVSENIASQIVNAVLDIVSSKSKYEKSSPNIEVDSNHQEGIIEMFFNKTEYREVLQFQIQDTIEDVLCDIYEKTLHQNSLSIGNLKSNIDSESSGANSEMLIERSGGIAPKLSVPKSDVILISNDIIDTVLHNLSSAVMLGINAKDSTSVMFPLTFSDTFPKRECQQSLLFGSKNERKTVCFPSSRNIKSDLMNDKQIIENDQNNFKNSIPDLCEENANSITKTIFNRLEFFATERIDSLITLAFQHKEKSFVNPELEDCKQDDIVHESSQVESNINVLKISTETLPTDFTFANYREKHGATVHLSKASLKEYADIIASVIMKLIKDYLDLEIQKSYTYSNNISFQENIFVSEIVNGILKILYDKRSVKEITFYSRDNSKLFSQLNISDKILLGQNEENTILPLLSKHPLEQNQMILEKEHKRGVLEEIFMRNEESKQQKEAMLISAVEAVLYKVHQRIMEIIHDLPPLSEISHLVPNSKIKADTTKKNGFQSHMNSVANDILESILEKMYSVVVSSVYELNKNREVDIHDHVTLSEKPSCIIESNQGGKECNPTRYVVPQVYPNAGIQNASLLQNTFSQYSPSQVGKDLVQMVVNKITNFASFLLDLQLKGHSDKLLKDSKMNSNYSPRPGFKTNLKAKSKVTPLPKFKPRSHIGSSCAKVKNIKLSPGEKTIKDTGAKTYVGLPHILSTGDAKNLLEANLTTLDFKMYANNIIIDILEKIVKEFERVEQARTTTNVERLPSDKIMEANKIVKTILQGLCTTANSHLTAHVVKCSHLDDLKPSQETIAQTQASFYLENVSSQLEQIFPKESIFKTIEEWQAESSDTKNEKCKLLTIAENILTEISIKAKELEYSLSILNLPQLYDDETRLHNPVREAPTRAEDTKSKINMFGKEIVELLLEKLQLCFLSQLPSLDNKQYPGSRNEFSSTTKGKDSFPTTDTLSNIPVFNRKMKHQIYSGSSNQIIQEIIEKVLNMLKSFVDLQLKHVSKYEFSEIVKMPIENLIPVQQRLLNKKTLPNSQSLKQFHESKPNTISKENIENTLIQVHSFHSELLTYAINIVTDMLGLIKNKLDKEISQEKPPSVDILKENLAASELIGALMNQCTHFYESLMKDLPKETFFQRVENTYIVNQVKCPTNPKIPIPKLKKVKLENNISQNKEPSLRLYSGEMKKNCRSLSTVPSNGNALVENQIKSSEPIQRPASQHMPSCSRQRLQDYSPGRSDFDVFNQDGKENNCPPEGSVLQKLFKNVNESTKAVLKEVISFMESEKSENPGVFHYETLNPVLPNHMETTVSPLKICLAAENIVNTVLSSYGFPSQFHTNENMETIKPFFISKKDPLSELSGKQMNEEKGFLRIWDKRNRYTSEEENLETEIRENVSLLHKWKTHLYPKIKGMKEFEFIAISHYELGPNEIHWLAKHVTTSVIIHFKNLRNRVSSEAKVSIISTLSRKYYESKQSLRNTYNDSSLYLLCDHLSDSVICHLNSSISIGSKEDREKEKIWKSRNEAFNKIISINSQVFDNKTISVGEVALSISETIIEILFNSNLIKVNISQETFSLRPNYIYCPEISAADFDYLFQDILVGVIYVLSKEFGLNCHLKDNWRKSYFVLSNNTVPSCNETNSMENQKVSGYWESSTHQLDHIIKKNKLNYLASKLDSLVVNVKNQESKEIVNKVFHIVVDLFLPDEYKNEITDSYKIARSFSLSSNENTPENNLGLTNKSVFLLNVVCEKLIRTLLEKCTNTVFENFDNGGHSVETSEECLHLKMPQNVEDYHKGIMDCEQLQGYCMPNFLDNLAEMDQDLLLSDSILTEISHSLVKSLMENLSHSIQFSKSPPVENKHLKYRTREINSNFVKAKGSELTELIQGKGSLGVTSDQSYALRKSLGDCTRRSDSKLQAQFGKKYSLKSPNLSHLKRKVINNMNTQALQSSLYLGDMNTSVYSATFLEEIISRLFFDLTISLWGQSEYITVTRLNEMSTLYINKIVNEFNNTQITVLRDAEEKLCCPPFNKQIVSKIVNSVYYDVLKQYKLEATYGVNLACENNLIVEKITNGILLEILDYQLPSCYKGKLKLNSYHSLNAEIILRKLQSKLKEFMCQHKDSTSYSTMLSPLFLEDIIRRLLPQLIPPPNTTSSFGKCHVSQHFNEMSTSVADKVKSAILKHKIWLTMCDDQSLYAGINLQTMVDSVYSSIVQIYGTLDSVQKSIASQCPMMVDRIASLIIQEIVENHLQPFLQIESLSRSKSPLDEVSNMVKQVVDEAVDSQRPSKVLHTSIYPDQFVEEIVVRLLSKIFNTKHSTEIDMENVSQKLVKSITRHFDKTKLHIANCDQEQCCPTIDNNIIDELVTSIYNNVLKQQGINPEVDEAPRDNDIFVENITKLVVAAISDYLLHPLFSGDSSTSSYSISTAQNIIQDIISNANKSNKASHNLTPYNSLMPYTFLEDMVRELLHRIFPSASNIPIKEKPDDRPNTNFNEIASKLISDIRKKISQYEIKISKYEEDKVAYSDYEVQHIVDSVFKNISQSSEFEESPEQNTTSINDTLIDRIAGFIIKYICQHYLQPFVDKKSLSLRHTYSDERKHRFNSNSFSETFMEDVVFGIVSRIIHRVLGIVQTNSIKYSDNELLDKAEKLVNLIAENFSKAQVNIIENAEEQYCLPPVAREDVKNIIDKVYSKILQEYEMKILPDKGFLSDTTTLAKRITEIILAECLCFQIHSNVIAKLPSTLHSKLNTNSLIRRLQCNIVKSKHQRQFSTYTTMLSHSHLEKIVTQLMSQISPLASSTENAETSRSIIKLINEIMSIISKHAICITKHGNEKQKSISEKDIQSMVDSIYADLSSSNTYNSLTKDKKGISSIPVSKTASFIIKEIFNHHLQTFSSEDKTCSSYEVNQIYKMKETDAKQKDLSFIVNSTFFFEEVISELLSKLLYVFSHNVLAAENPHTVKVQITNIVTTLVNSIVHEFTTSEILLADNFDKTMCDSEVYKQMVKISVDQIYEKILAEYSSMAHLYVSMQSDPACFGKKLYNLLLEKVYEYQVQSLISGESMSASYSSLNVDNIIRKVLKTVINDDHALPSYITVLSRPLLEDIIFKLLGYLFPLSNKESKLDKKNVLPDSNFVDAASKVTNEIIEEIFEHEIHLDVAEQNPENVQLDSRDTIVDSICNNILKKSEFKADIQKSTAKKGDSFLTKIAGFIIKEIMNHHLQPFLNDEKSSSTDLPDSNHTSVPTKPEKEKKQPSLYSAQFLEDVVVDLVHKFYSLPSKIEESDIKKMAELDIVDLAIKFAKSLIEEFNKSDIKVLQNAEEMFSFPSIDKETVDMLSDLVYDQFIGKNGSSNFQKDDKNNIFIEMVASLVQKAISAFKIQTLFSGDWSSTLISFLNTDNITQRIQNLPQKISTQISRCLKENQFPLPETPPKHISPASEQKTSMHPSKVDGNTVNKKKVFQTATSNKMSDKQDLKCTSLTNSLKRKVANLLSGSGIAHKKENENKRGMSIKKYKITAKNTYATSGNVENKATNDPKLMVTFENNKIEEKSISSSKEKEQNSEVYEEISVFADTESKKELHEPDFEIDNEKKIGKRETSLKKDDSSRQLALIPQVNDQESTIKPTLETGNYETDNVNRKEGSYADTFEEHYSNYEHVQNVVENIYDNILKMYQSHETINPKVKDLPSDKSSFSFQASVRDFEESVSTQELAPSANQHANDEGQKKKEKEQEEKDKVKRKEIKNESSKHPEYSPKSKPGIFHAKFLEDIITEMIKKLIFSSSSEIKTYTDKKENVKDDEIQAEIYNTAMKLIDSLLKEFTDAQIKVFKPDKESQNYSSVSKPSASPKLPPVNKVPPMNKVPFMNTDKSSFSTKEITVNKMQNMSKISEKPSLNKSSFLDKISKIDKTLVNKIVHSSICNILKELRSQDFTCKNIKINGEKIAKILTSTVIDEIFKHELDFRLCDEVRDSECLPQESKGVIKESQKVVQTASRECQTSSPYTIMLAHEFLEKIISALLIKIFSSVHNDKAETSEGDWFTELNFLQIKLVSTIKTEIAKDEDMIIQYVECLHSSDDEIIKIVVDSIYNNLLSQFGSNHSLKDCASTGCKILSETIVDLVLREVTGNQLQNYFSGELTPNQCAEVDSVVENILKGVFQTASPPQNALSHCHILPYNIIEEIAVKFLSKLLSMFPKVEKEKSKSLENEKQKIASKILNSLQDFISRSKVKLVPPVKEVPTVASANKVTIDKVVDTVYGRVLKHSGSHTSVFKDLMGKSNVLSDIIGFLMVKEVANTEFQPQVQEASSSQLVLEAVKIIEKVLKILDESKTPDKSLSKKDIMLDTTLLEEALALFLAKVVKLPSASSKEEKKLSKVELNKIASQLTKSVTAETSENNISLVTADAEEHVLSSESIEIISRVVDNVYSKVLQQSGSQQELYDDIRKINNLFPKKVASLIISSVSNISLDTTLSKNSNSDVFNDLDISRIVEKAEEHADQMSPTLDHDSDEHIAEEESYNKIVPHIGNKPLKIDPDIISEHLAVISVKTLSLEKLKTECLRTTGHSITELRKASISGKSYQTSELSVEKMKKERRISLDRTGRLDVKPLEAYCRNSFQNVIKPDITKVELLKDVQNKKELIIRLVAHDIDQEEIERKDSYEDEVILNEVIQEGFEDIVEMKESMKLEENKSISSKTTLSNGNLKKMLSLSKCCLSTSSVNIKNVETTLKSTSETKKELSKNPIIEHQTDERSKSVHSTSMVHSHSYLDKKLQHEKEEHGVSSEPTHYFIHRIMSTSSYNHEDLASSAGEKEGSTRDTGAETFEENFQKQKPDNSSSVEFITMFGRNEDITNETSKFNVPKQGSKMLAKVSSALSKVFSQASTNNSKLPSSSHQNEN